MKQILFILTLCVLCFALHAQTIHPITYQAYMDRVSVQNLTYAAQKLGVNLADVHIQAAKIFNDPQLALGYENNNDWHMMMGQGFSGELSKTFAFGKRRANIDLARSEKELTQALLEDYFRNLYADATLTYLNALQQQAIFEVKKNAYRNIQNLASADSIKFLLGKITQVDATQSRVEADMMQNELRQTRADLNNSFSALSPMMGRFNVDTLYTPLGTVTPENRSFELTELLTTALNNRADLVASLRNVDVAKRTLTVARRERNMDIDLSLGVSHSTLVRNELAPAPQFTGVAVGIAIPLKFSNLNKGNIKAANLEVRQAELNYGQAEVQVQSEVAASYRNYQALSDRVITYNSGLLDKARSVVEGKIYGYNRGENSLLEVLSAQRTYDEVRLGYIETFYACAAALVELGKSVGVTEVVIE